MGPRALADINWAKLPGRLVENYDGLLSKLTRRLGSFLRLDRATDAVPVRSPADYIFHTAINIAKGGKRPRAIAAVNPRSMCFWMCAMMDPTRREL